MNLTRCSNGHFYDADKYSACPHCNSSVQPVDDSVTVSLSSSQDMKTEALDNDNSATLTLSDAIDLAGSTEPVSLDDSKTVSFYSESMGTDPVVGWLVCLNGKHFGEGFQLKAGRNFIGRSAGMDVILDDDHSVSRDRHAIIIYEPKSRSFIAQPGDSRELFYLNGNVVLNNELVKDHDIFTIGKTRLMFIPCCNDKFSWEDLENESEE